MDEAQTKIPAPERDLANVSPQVPPASDEPSPVTQWVFASLAIGLGTAMIVLAVVAAVFAASPIPETVLARDARAAWLLVGLSGLFFAGCGWGILRRSTALTLLSLILAVVTGWMASLMA
jgi:hypothetical protein